jgi:hypothetical protein
MSTMFITLYLIPLIVVLLGAIPWAKRDIDMGVPIFLLAILPVINFAAAVVIVIVRVYQAIAGKRT